MLKNINKNKILMVLVIVLAVGLIFALFGQKMKANDGYSVVYMTTGEVYVGKISTFPSFTISNGFILQAIKDPTDSTKNTFQLNPFKNTFWGTEKLHLNSKQIVFYGPIGKDSQIDKALAGK